MFILRLFAWQSHHYVLTEDKNHKISLFGEILLTSEFLENFDFAIFHEGYIKGLRHIHIAN